MRRGDRVTLFFTDGTSLRDTITSSEGNDIQFESGASLDLVSMTYTPKIGPSSQVDEIQS